MAFDAGRSRPGHGAAPKNELNLPPSLAADLDLDGYCEAYVVLVCTPSGWPRRRVYLSLAAAQKAAGRAHGHGQPVRMGLCRLSLVSEFGTLGDLGSDETSGAGS